MCSLRVPVLLKADQVTVDRIQTYAVNSFRNSGHVSGSASHDLICAELLCLLRNISGLPPCPRRPSPNRRPQVCPNHAGPHHCFVHEICQYIQPFDMTMNLKNKCEETRVSVRFRDPSLSQNVTISEPAFNNCIRTLQTSPDSVFVFFAFLNPCFQRQTMCYSA